MRFSRCTIGAGDGSIAISCLPSFAQGAAHLSACRLGRAGRTLCTVRLRFVCLYCPTRACGARRARFNSTEEAFRTFCARGTSIRAVLSSLAFSAADRLRRGVLSGGASSAKFGLFSLPCIISSRARETRPCKSLRRIFASRTCVFQSQYAKSMLGTVAVFMSQRHNGRAHQLVKYCAVKNDEQSRKQPNEPVFAHACRRIHKMACTAATALSPRLISELPIGTLLPIRAFVVKLLVTN